MADPGRGGGGRRGRDGAGREGAGATGESAELRRLRGRIDALDRRIVRLLNERAELGREVGREKRRQGRMGVRDLEREREVLLRVAMANLGPLRQADLLAIYRRLVSATRAIEAADAAAERERQVPRRAVHGAETDRGSGSRRPAGTKGTPGDASEDGSRVSPHVADDAVDGEPPAGGR